MLSLGSHKTYNFNTYWQLKLALFLLLDVEDIEKKMPGFLKVRWFFTKNLFNLV